MFLLLILWTIYFFLHSLLAANSVKKRMEFTLGRSYRYYRLVYNFISFAGFAGIIWFQLNLPSVWLFPSWYVLRLIGGILIIVGSLLGLIAVLQYNMSEFMGLGYIIDPQKPGGDVLITNGLNRYVRHPMYFALIMVLTGYLLTSFTNITLLFVFIVFCYLVIGTILEEKKLVEAFGDEYRDYRKRVKMLIPFLW